LRIKNKFPLYQEPLSGVFLFMNIAPDVQEGKSLPQMETATIVLLEGLGTLAVLVAQMCR